MRGTKTRGAGIVQALGCPVTERTARRPNVVLLRQFI